MLTTLTPYWNRPDQLRTWLACLAAATCPGLTHWVVFIGEEVPDWVRERYGRDARFCFESFLNDKPGDFSIGHYHNLGARRAVTEWIMKLDVDALPHPRYFPALLQVLKTAVPRQWFNGGMVYVNRDSSLQHLSDPVTEATYRFIMHNQRIHCGPLSFGPAATNFICRRSLYLGLGGCDARFKGYGWEDYQQIYMLERHFCQADPLPGRIGEDNITQRCCHEISRPRARELYARNHLLCLLHHFHPASHNTDYKSPTIIAANRRVLLDYILTSRRHESERRHPAPEIQANRSL